MIKCPKCNHCMSLEGYVCSHCSFTPQIVDGFVAWAPNLAFHNNGFNPENYSFLEQAEAKNFWFRARNELIINFLKKYCGNFQSFFEIGCGTGYVLSGINESFPGRKIFGSEIYTKGLEFSQKRLPNANLFQMDAREIPFEDEFDVIGAFDVIEHIDDDNRVLKNIHRATKENGFFLLTVPQHQWLWSPVDEAACHQRRYAAKDLHQKIKAAGFTILRSTSFVSFLLPLMIASRIKSKKTNKTSSEIFNMNPIINDMMKLTMDLEKIFIKLGCDFPIGGSRIVVAKK